MLPPENVPPGKPIAVIGAGDLVSHLQRGDDERDPDNYQFNVFRFGEDLAATHALRPCDVRDMVKLCQVLAFTIADDGWIPVDVRRSLIELASDLDDLTRRWSDTNHG